MYTCVTEPYYISQTISVDISQHPGVLVLALPAASTSIASDDGSGSGDDSEWDWEHIRNIRADLLSYDYTQVDELYERSQGGGDAAGNPTDTMVSTSVNAGRGIINYCGHGGTTIWATTGFNNSDVNAPHPDQLWPEHGQEISCSGLRHDHHLWR